MAADAPRPVARHERAQRLCGIYAILNEAPGLLELARAVLDAGVKLVQYRAKGGIVPKNLGILRAMTSESDALLMLNDDWRVAVEFECDGVHWDLVTMDSMRLHPSAMRWAIVSLASHAERSPR